MRGDVRHAIHVQQFRVGAGDDDDDYDDDGDEDDDGDDDDDDDDGNDDDDDDDLGRFLGGGSHTKGWLPPAVARTGPLPSELSLERCRYKCADVR